MKQNLLKTWLMLVLMLVGAGTMWADADVAFTFSDQGYTNGQVITSGTIDSYTSWSATKGGSNDPAYYTTGTGLRVYNGGKFSITSSKTIASITLTFSASGYTFSTSNTTTPQTVEPNTTSYSWDVSRTSRLQKIEITYASSGGSTPSHMAYFYVNGTLQNEGGTSYAEGASIKFPDDPADINGKKFMGWTMIKDYSNATTAPSDMTKSTTMGNDDVTYYAVFASGGSTTSSVNISDYAAANSWQGNGAMAYKSITLDENITVSTTGTGNNGKYYSDWRLYQSGNGNIIVTAESECTLTSAKFTFTFSNTGDLKYGNSSVQSGKSVKISGSTATFVVGNTGAATNGQVKVTAIEVTYLSPASDYCTTVGEAKTPTSLTWSEATATATIGASNSLPTLTTTPADLTGVTYSSSNTEVASIDENTGTITLNAAGETTIKASYAGNATYAAATDATYTLTVNSAAPTTYTVTVDNNIANGTVTADPTSAAEGTTVTLTATPSTGYEFGSWNVTNASTSAAITVTDNKFTMPAADVNVSATFNQIQGGGDEPADGDYVLTDIADLRSGDVVVIVDQTSSKALGNDNGTNGAPKAVDVTLLNDKSSMTSTANNIEWTVTISDGKYRFSTGKNYLYVNGANNNGLRVGANGSNLDFEWATTSGKNYHLKGTDGSNSRYVGVYYNSNTPQDWRCYTSISSNIEATKTAFYIKSTPNEPGEKTTPTLSFASATATAYLDALSLFVAPELTTDPENLSGVTYSMTGDNVGTINSSTGALTLTAAGTATITASYAGDDVNYNAAEDASYTLTVNAKVPEKTIAEFVESKGGVCYLTGVVSNIAANNYGNFDLTDETGTIYVYGCLTPEGQKQQFNTLGVVVGDKIKVLANEYTVFNEKEEAVNVIFVEEIEIEKTKYTVTIVTPENGTLVVKDGETVLASGDQVEEGNTITIECTPTDAENYRYKNWQYKEDGNWITNTTTMTRVVTKDISIRANFELIPTYTIAWSVNGVIVKTDENVKQGAALTAPEVTAINGKNFTGWVTTPTVASDATPEYVTPATPNTADPTEITYYAVFADGDGSSEETWNKVTDASTLSAGDVVTLVSSTVVDYNSPGTKNKVNGYVAISTQNTNNWKGVGVTIENDVLTSLDNVQAFTLTATSSDSYPWAFSYDNKYIYAAGGNSNNYLKSTETLNDAASFSINIEEGVATIVANVPDAGEKLGRNVLQVNGSYNSGSTAANPVFNCYASTSEQTKPAIYKKTGGAEYSDFTTIPEVTFTSAGTISFVATTGEGDYYATFSSDKITAFPTDPSDDVILNVESVYINADGTITKFDFEDDYTSVNDNKVIIPANTGVLLHAFTTEDAAPSVSYEFTNAESETSKYDPDFNMLVPCTSTAIFKASADDNYYYKLAYGDNTNKTKLGFWWGANDGSGNFKVKAGGAILRVPQETAVKMQGFSFDMFGSDETAIKQVENTHAGEAIYNLQGMRMQKLQKGINIVKGKKVVVK